MDAKQFIENIEGAIEGVTPGSVTLDTIFRNLEQWESIAALMTLAMIFSEYDVQVSGIELQACNTIGDLYRVVESKVMALA
ncbi:MAG: phosphopantetheine-binding protein [Vampirovibrionales bacterium]|nr:phosphopantetheine-binding protein [Vampirovibrionales bacterium]